MKFLDQYPTLKWFIGVLLSALIVYLGIDLVELPAAPEQEIVDTRGIHTDDLKLGDDLTVVGDLDVTGAVTLNSTLDVDGNITSGTSAITVTDSLVLTGQADANQFTVTGYTTQTNKLAVFEQSGGTDVVTVANDGTVAMVDGTVSDDLAVTDDASVGGVLTIAELLSSGTSITATNGADITATAFFQPITAAGTVTPTLGVLTAGKSTCLVNTVAQSIVVQDTGTAKLTGDHTMGQYDVLCLWSDGTNMIEVGYSDN